ncbi:MAG TPA: HlyD family secretion protein [Polyangiaceae bacterium]|nr:HlyD family secretion protein [Polyangiaceae bacterium]
MATATADSVETAPAPTQEATQPRSKKSLVLGIVAAAVIGGGGLWYVTHHGLEDTDNAQIDGDVVSVPSRIGGVVTKIQFTENQRVKAGDLLAEIDPAPAQARLAEADANVLSAQAQADAADATARVSETNAVGDKSVADASLVTAAVGAASTSDQINEAIAQLTSAQTTLAQAQVDHDRAQRLLDTGAISKAEFDRADTQLKVAQSSVDLAKARLISIKGSAAQAQSRVVEAKAKAKISNDVDTQIRLAQARANAAHAQVETAKAARDLAALDVSYTKIFAPNDGVVSKKSINVGQMLSPGQSIVQLVPDKLWVTGNFKETQVAKMRVGQPAKIEVDAFSGTEIDGEVESFSGATGAKFTLLPPDNATGNFTKIVQRLPVRVRIKELPAGIVLRPGMSVDLTVDTRK